MITQPTEEYFKDGQWGWDGTRWRKLPLTWGFTARISGQVVDADADAGTNVLQSDIVPAGEIWVIDYVNALNVQTAPSLVLISLFGGGIKVIIVQSNALPAGVYLTGAPKTVLQVNDRIEYYFSGCTAGDDLHCRWWGYKMAVT